MEWNPRLNTSWWTLRLAFGLVPIVAGLDKYLNLLTNWEQYLYPLAPNLLHISPVAFMHIVGVIEIAAGVLILTPFTRYAAYIVMAWLVLIALNLVSQGRFFDVAVRDVVMSLSAFVLAKLTEVHDLATAAHTSGASDPGGHKVLRTA